MYSVFNLFLYFSSMILLFDGKQQWFGMPVETWLGCGLTGLLAVVLASFFGLLAIWAGWGRGNWFLRLAVVLGCISLLTIIPAYELVFVYLIQTGATFIGLTLRRQRTRRATDCRPLGETPLARWKCSLRDFLLLAVVVAWISAMLICTPPDVWKLWTPFAIEGLVMAVFTATAFQIALGNWRWWLRLSLFILIFPSALMAGWLAAWRAIHSRKGSRRVALARVAIVLLSLVVFLPTAATYWQLNQHPAMPPTTEPKENSYNTLVLAGKSLNKVDVPDFEKAAQAELKTYVSQCGDIHATVRVALAKPCQVPSKKRLCDKNLSTGGISEFRAITRALQGEGKLAAMEGRKSDAIAAYFDAIRLGQAQEQGGLLVDWLVGITIKGIGRAGIADMRKSFTAIECRATLATLLEMSAKPSTLDECMMRDAVWEDLAFGWQCRLWKAISSVTSSHSILKGIAYGEKRDAVKFRLLICDLAIRAYTLERGRAPDKLADLAPDYLPQVPRDPFSAGEFVYRPTPNGFELRSEEKDMCTGEYFTTDKP